MRFSWYILVLVLMVGCRVDKQTDLTVISELIQQYPELATENDEKYTLLKTVILPDNKATFRLYSLPISTDYDNQIIVIINKQGKRRGIPLFHNAEAKYWHFEHDPENKRQQTVSLFESTFIDAINELGLNDTTGTGYLIFYHLMQSVLNCEVLSVEEVPLLETPSVDGDTEVEEVYEKRLLLSKQSIVERMKSDEYDFVTYANAFYEEDENRVIQFHWPSGKKGKIKSLNLWIYRMDHRLRRLYM